MLLMEDAVRPSEVAFNAMYERGYRKWAAFWEKAVADEQLPDMDPCLAFPNVPYFPKGLALDKSFSNTVTARGKTTWKTTQGPCDLPSL
jgi:hypothetical protein